jgi:hypothetical protein
MGFFATKMIAIRCLCLLQFMAGFARSDLPTETHGPKIDLGLLDKQQTANGDALRPSPFPDILFAFEKPS